MSYPAVILAEKDMRCNEHEISTSSVLRLVKKAGHSSYDCEYVALAQFEGITLVTGDQEVVDAFPDTAVLLETFVS